MSRKETDPAYFPGKYAGNSCLGEGRNLMYMSDKQRLAYWELKQPENIEANEKQENANTKKCSKCGQLKRNDYFGRHPKSKDGYLPECKSCRSSKETTPVHSMDNEVKEMISAMPKAVYGNPKAEELTDKALADELRKRGYEVRATKTIEI